MVLPPVQPRPRRFWNAFPGRLGDCPRSDAGWADQFLGWEVRLEDVTPNADRAWKPAGLVWLL